MTKGRMEAFSDGVIAILITIMVLQLQTPRGAGPAALRPLLPVFLGYALSFTFLGVYWNHHHHLMQAARTVNGRILWANHHLLFWLSLVAFATDWMSKTRFAAFPVAVYGVVLLACALAYVVFARALVAHHGIDSPLAAALHQDGRDRVSLACYAAAVPLAFVHPYISCALYALVALLWLVPNRRIEKAFSSPPAE